VRGDLTPLSELCENRELVPRVPRGGFLCGSCGDIAGDLVWERLVLRWLIFSVKAAGSYFIGDCHYAQRERLYVN